jgi:hypothetical protein
MNSFRSFQLDLKATRRLRVALALCLSVIAGCGGGYGGGGSGGGMGGGYGGMTTMPTITAQPASQTVMAPATATFSVTAGGTAPLSYQWMRNSSNISGATMASYTTPPTTTMNSGESFAVVVTNAYGTKTSSPAVLTVM